MIKISQIKQQARSCVRQARPKAWWMTLVYLLVTAGLSYVAGLFVADPIIELSELYTNGVPLDRAILLAVSTVGGTGLFINLVLMLAGIVFDFGYSMWCLGTTRGGIGELGDLLGGFALTGRVLLLRLMTLLYSFMWYVVIFMPALLVLLVGAALPVIGPLLAVAAFLGAMFLFLRRVLGYSMAGFCLMDEPDKGVTHALRTSQRLMQHQVGRYVLLLLSFFGWVLLASLISAGVELLILLVSTGLTPVLGLGAESLGLMSKIAMMVGAFAAWPLYLWLTPYMTMSQCKFYDKLKDPEDAVPF
ncbi:MAG: DUF975 family protein [Oscillospiraceae bacterium]|nr:DUF975 family protein [Oscillospiraceae bacterium]